ncbi:MAG: RecQ family ATP-dependent DNA helicase [Sphingobacteriales bacterium]|nr:RecQ family ATP-dependent DNA helicase [Sphingobacteriales bacterium]
MTIHQVLKQYWGYDAFRALQEEIVQSVLEGKDTLALLPTGGGKSICFQVPALVQPGICVVVSPLIALMKDQVENLKVRGIEAVAIVSGMSKREVDILLDNCVYGKIKFLYISPERLSSPLVQERIRHMNVNLFAIDEAHCISQWGYDFRPPYLQLAELRELHPKVPILALTATATQQVADDIVSKLVFKKGFQIFRKSFERTNLSYVVANEENKLKRLLKLVNTVKGSGIVYVRNRRETQELARQLALEGIKADFYHAGLAAEVRSQKQDDWKANKLRVIVATNAFGMGIDKPDVRFVAHMDLPESLEAYYQEAGRAGRDEKKSYAVLLYNDADVKALERKLAQGSPSLADIQVVYHQLGNHFQVAYGAGEGLLFPFDLADFCKKYKLEPIKTINILKVLSLEGYIGLTESVYLPSRLQVIVDYEALYSFQLSNAAYEPLLKTLLRSYGGLYDQYVPIKEQDLAKRLQITASQVAQMLTKLNDMQLIAYEPKTDQPQVQFLRSRVDRAHLGIDYTFLAQRQAIYQKQVESVLHYVNKPICRSQQLLNYFDELTKEKCGVCDVCIGARKKNPDVKLKNAILEIVSKNPLSITDLVDMLTDSTVEHRLSFIRSLVDDGKLILKNDVLYSG